ncbi:MAG: RNA pseudouridine synthase [Bacteroidota bacterium]
MEVKKDIGSLVLYKNNQLIAFNKPNGLTVQADKTQDISLHSLGEIYCKSKLHLVHRIDRPASGVVLFAKNTKALATLNEAFQQRKIEKTYLAVVGKIPADQKGTLEHFLKKQPRGNKSVVSSADEKNAKLATLSYRLLGSTERYHLLEVQLYSGRHHQIRAQLAAIGSPIKGDNKYGFRRMNRDRSIHLHAWKLRFTHPTTQQQETVVAPLPDEVLWNAFKAPIAALNE